MKYKKLSYGDGSCTGGGGSSVGSSSSSTSSSSSSTLNTKRSRKYTNWGTRERTGMSFLIVIAFFAVFGLIILTEIFMIDDRANGSMMILRGGGGYGVQLGDSMPDYDNVKEDYELMDDVSLLSDSKWDINQYHGGKLKTNDYDINERRQRLNGFVLNSDGTKGVYGTGVAGGGGGGTGLGVAALSGNGPYIPWGKMLSSKVEETLPSYPFALQPSDGSWQIVNGTRFKFFIFSAYYDRRDGAKLIRVIGATKTRGPERVWCRLWYVPHNVSSLLNRDLYKSVTVMARVKIIRENWNLKYSACFVLCPIRMPDYDVPQFVSIVSRLRAPPGNLLLLRNTDWDADFINIENTSINGSEGLQFVANPERMPNKLAVCVKPFHFNYDQALFLMEYLEFYALLGVKHFTFYNHTIGPHANCVLQHYVSGDIPENSTATDTVMTAVQRNSPKFEGKESPEQPATISSKIKSNYLKPSIEILPWNLRMRSQKEIRTEGLFAALNDCLYRTMYRYKYLAMVDLDEFIVPKHNDTLNDLINSLNDRFPNRNIGSYSFQNAFFYLQFNDDPLVSQTKPTAVDGNIMKMNELAKLRANLITQRKTRRRVKLHPQKQRSKYICKPATVVEAGNHFVWEFLPGKGSLNVPPTEAILQHYRVCEFGGNDCIKAPSLVDRTATKYVNRLLERVLKVYKHLKDKCKLPDLPSLPPLRTKMAKNQASPNLGKHDSIRSRPVTRSASNTPSQKQQKEKPANTTVIRAVRATNKIPTPYPSVTPTTTTNFKIHYNPTSIKSTVKGHLLNEMKVESKTENTTQSLRRRIVVFFVDDKGNPRVRLEYH